MSVSRGPLLDAVNAVFERLMTKKSADISYDESHKLKFNADYPPHEGEECFTGAPVELHLLPEKVDLSDAPANGEYRLQIRDGDVLSPELEASEPLKNQCSHFLDCVASGAKPMTNGRDGERVVRVLEAVDRSLSLNGAPVEVMEEAYDGRWEKSA